MRNCNRCGVDKADDLFYASSPTICKECVRAKVRQYRVDNLEEVRDRDRKRGFRGGGVPKEKRVIAEMRSVYPEKAAARIALGNAVRDGKIIKPSACEKCGRSARLHGHHDDYARPLDIRWLCPGCHGAYHRAENDRLRQVDRDAYSLVLACIGARFAALGIEVRS